MSSLAALASLMRDGENVISPYVTDSDAEPALGALAAAGPRAAEAPDEYTLLMEAIRSGATGFDDLTNYVDYVIVTNRTLSGSSAGVASTFVASLMSAPCSASSLAISGSGSVVNSFRKRATSPSSVLRQNCQ